MLWSSCQTLESVISQPEYLTNYQQLKEILGSMAPVAVAFSGGVDSSLLLKVAHDVLDDRCVAVTVDAPYHFRQELADAANLAKQLGVKHRIIPFDPATIPGLMNNPDNRCYLCKKALLKLCLSSLVPDLWTLVDGSTLDDQTAHRPGRRALHELGIRSPLAEAGLTKQQIRLLSKERGLPIWNKPAQSCLLTRFRHNHTVTEADLRRVEQCEEKIKTLGFSVVRVRSREECARIECKEREQAQAMLPELEAICRQTGFTTVEIDPAGYRSGSMD
jgi:uncharacterized protein